MLVEKYGICFTDDENYAKIFLRKPPSVLFLPNFTTFGAVSAFSSGELELSPPYKFLHQRLRFNMFTKRSGVMTPNTHV